MGSPVTDLLVEFAKLDLGSKPESYGGCSPCGPSDVPRKRYFPTVYISGQDKSIDLPDEGVATIEYKVRGRSMNERDGKKQHSADIEIRTIEPGKKPAAKKIQGMAKLIPNPVVMMEDLRRVVGLARGDVILRNLDKVPKRIGASVKETYEAMGPVLKRDLSGMKGLLKKRALLPGLITDRAAGATLRANRDSLAKQIRKGRGAARMEAAAQSDISRAKKKIGFSRNILSDIIEFDSRPRNNYGQFAGAESGGADPDSMHAAYGPGTVAKAAGLGALGGGAAVAGLQANKARKALSSLARRV